MMQRRIRKNMTTKTATPVEARAAAWARWRQHVEVDLKGAPFEKKLVTRTREGIDVQPLYGAGDSIPAADGRRGWRVVRPGERSWEITQRIVAPDPATFNVRLRAALMAGQDAVVLGLDDVDGLVWAARDWSKALAGVDFSAVPLHLCGDVHSVSRRRMFLAWACEHGIDLGTLRGGMPAEMPGPRDAAEEFGAGRRNGQSAGWDELAAWVNEVAESAPALRTIGVNGRRWHEAGGTAVHELGFALASAVETLRELESRRVSLATAATRLQVTFAIGPRFFTEVAKFRAWRILWAKALTAAGMARHAPACFVAAESAARNKSRLDAHTNLLRITTEGLSAVLGGVDALQLAPHDELDGSPSERAVRVARNLHLLLGEEFHLTDTADPAGGSWYAENLTDELARAAWQLFQEIETRGGMTAALTSNWPQAQVRAAATQEERAVAQRRRGIVGTNLFPNPRDRVASPEAGGAARFGGDALAPRRLAEPFEALRWASQNASSRPVVHLARVGTVKHYKARADFAAGFYAVGGCDIRPLPACENASEAAEAARAAGARTVVLCSSDDLYPEVAPAFVETLKAAGEKITVVLAGLPADPALVERYRAAGIDEFIHLKADVIELNHRLLTDTGVLS